MMKINWLPQESQKEDVNFLLQEEYRFRLKVTRVLLDKLKDHDDTDFDHINFDFDTTSKSFKISKKTPEPMYTRLKKLSHLLV